MSYTVEITFADPPGPESDDGLPTSRLEGSPFATAEAARDAANKFLADMGDPPGRAWFRILDPNGHDVGNG